MCCLVLLITISLQLLASYNRCLPSLLAFTSSYALHLQSYRNHVKKASGNFKNSARKDLKSLGGSEKDFLKILKWQHKLVRDYKQGKLVSYFLNNAPKSCLYGLKISGNIETEHIFQSKGFFHLSGNLHISCFSLFNSYNLLRKRAITTIIKALRYSNTYNLFLQLKIKKLDKCIIINVK